MVINCNEYNYNKRVSDLEKCKADKSPFIHKNQIVLNKIQVTGTYNVDLSEYLPQDGGIYEIWITSHITSTSVTKGSIFLLNTDVMTEPWTINQLPYSKEPSININVFSCFAKSNLVFELRLVENLSYGASATILGYRKVI